nr:alpha/beta hydrolase [Rhodoferax sp.]
MTKHDKNWLDRMYNNRALVPEHGRHFMQWEQASSDAREAHPHQCDIRYGQGPMEVLDIFPSPKPGAPVVVFIHGGYWRSLDKSDHSFIAPAFTNEGACVVIPNYALCPAVTIPQIVMQMVKALAWTWRHIARYGGDPSRITVIGHSAGGHLATLLLACHWPAYAKELPADLVKSAMSISGLYDLEPIMHTPFLKDALQLTPEQVNKVSPAGLPRPKQGVLYTLVGGDESAEFLRHNTLMQAAWGKKTVPVQEALPGLNHFSALEALTAPWHRLHQLAMKVICF